MNNTRINLGPLGRAACMLTVAGGLSWAAGTGIGMAVADGRFEVDGARVSGSTTIFEGSHIKSGNAVSQLKINGAVRMRLGSQAEATVFGRRLVLEAGDSQLEGGSGYEVEARTLRIASTAPETVARVRMMGRRVTVATVRGGVQVANAAGVVVANIESGMSLDFEPQEAGAAAPVRVSGCLLQKEGKWIVVDQTTNVVLEVQGDGLAAQGGNRVEITGAAAKASAGQSIKVAGMKQVAKGGCSAVAKKIGATVGAGAVAAASTTGGSSAGAGAAAAAGTAAATSTTATVAVIGGVAAAATVGGLAAVGSLPGQGDPTPSASR